MGDLPNHLRRSEQRLLLKLNGLDTTVRGCFARRQTLAKMLNYSLHTINADLSRLRRRGYLNVATKGRGRDEAATVKLTPLGRRNANSLQAEYNHSLINSDNLIIEKQQQPKKSPPTKTNVVDKEKPVLKKKKESPQTNEKQKLLKDEGIDSIIASRLASKNSKLRILACIKYVSQSRGDKINQPGMIVSALSGKWKLPQWAFEGVKETINQPEMRSPDRSDQKMADSKPQRDSAPIAEEKMKEPLSLLSPIKEDIGIEQSISTPQLTERQILEAKRRHFLESDHQQWKAQVINAPADKKVALSHISKMRQRFQNKSKILAITE